MLRETTLEGVIDKELVAIERIKQYEPEEGYYVAFSGGKDSIVVYDLVKRADVKHDAHINITTVEPPEVLHFVRTTSVSIKPKEKNEKIRNHNKAFSYPYIAQRRKCFCTMGKRIRRNWQQAGLFIVQ